MTTPAPSLDPAAFTDDPEIAALLDFPPVIRRCKRHDGWTAENQYAFIVGLAETGSTDKAAVALGRTSSGAWKVRKSAGGEGFDCAWDIALALYDARHPRPRVAPTGAGVRWARHRQRQAPPAAPSPDAPFRALALMPDEAEEIGPEEALEIRVFADMIEPLIHRYLSKLKEERSCRLEGRIVEADFCVRQLTMIELALDLGGAAGQLLARLKAPNGMELVDIAATPFSVLLAGIRRDYWQEKGEPERPPLPPLGEHDKVAARGEPIAFLGKRDGAYRDWNRRQDEKHRLAAEAQEAWEEKARADAAAWAAQPQQSSPGFPGESRVGQPPAAPDRSGGAIDPALDRVERGGGGSSEEPAP